MVGTPDDRVLVGQTDGFLQVISGREIVQILKFKNMYINDILLLEGDLVILVSQT